MINKSSVWAISIALIAGAGSASAASFNDQLPEILGSLPATARQTLSDRDLAQFAGTLTIPAIPQTSIAVAMGVGIATAIDVSIKQRAGGAAGVGWGAAAGAVNIGDAAVASIYGAGGVGVSL
jgi:hypothetical protein